jgi:arabinogalactan oligomer/maltooligosaccharide transport system permease protein
MSIDTRTPRWVSIGSHLVLGAATLFAVYPVLWVVSLAFSADSDAPEPRVVPWPSHPTLGIPCTDPVMAIGSPSRQSGAREERISPSKHARTVAIRPEFGAER